MRTFNFNTHTIIMLVGASNCGKSHFSKNTIINGIKKEWSEKCPQALNKLNIQYISSDEIRKELLGDMNDFHKHDISSYKISEQAFDIFFTKLKAVTSFPVNAQYVILDTTGLNESFRNKVIDISKANNYKLDMILFKYKNTEDYYKFVNEDDTRINKNVISKHVKILKENVVSKLNRKQYNKIHTINYVREIENNEISVVCDNIEKLCSHYIDDNYEYIIIGDLHGCYTDFKELLSKKHFITFTDNDEIIFSKENQKIILIGDYIDKGHQTEQLINFIHKNRDKMLLVIGNHENFSNKYINNIIKDKEDGKYDTLINLHFDTIRLFEKNEEIKNKFMDLINISKEFYLSKHFIVCHAPAEQKYLGKIDDMSLRHQRNLFFEKKRGEFNEESEYMAYLKDKIKHMKDSSNNSLKVIYGHLAFDDIYKSNNYIGIDTGCVYGNKLTSVTFPKYRDYSPTFFSIKSEGNKKYTVNELINICHHNNISKGDEYVVLDDFDKKRINNLINNKVNYISGTMAPCDIDKEKNELESLEKGLQYYKENNVNTIVLQPKYMGSRMQVYLNARDYTKSYSTTRNGYVIKNEELQNKLIPIYKQLYEKFISENSKANNTYEWIIIDGEICPWAFLGKGLIDKTFNPVLYAAKNEFSFLKDTEFEKHLNNLYNGEYLESGFKSDKNKSNAKKELREKFGDAKYKTYETIGHFIPQYSSIEESEKNLEIFKEQMDIFGKDGEVIYYPFSVLKIVFSDGNEKIYENSPFLNDNQKMYDFLNDEPCKVISLDSENYLEEAHNYFNEITVNKSMEGIVLKPINVLTENKKIVPYIKCRNKKYLTLVYGYDYLNELKYNKLISRKGVKNKMKISVSEFNIGLNMLKTKYNEISNENKTYKKVLINMIKEEKQEKQDDPRL